MLEINMNVEKKPEMLKVARVKQETGEHVTLFFKKHLPFKPGQFVMLWLPGVDEKPYTVSYHGQDEFGVTVEAKGRFSKKAVLLKEGDLMGVRGPFGNGFDMGEYKQVCVVSGGCGTAPIAPLLDALKGGDVTVIQGARSDGFLLFRERYAEMKTEYCTDDGSFGRKGFVTEALEEAIQSKTFDMVYACGPEIMMKGVFDLCEKHGIPCQVSLERYMRCGFGVCGACVCGKERVCIDGPVFASEKLREMKDFNTSALLKSGAEVGLSDYFSWRCA